VRSDPAPIQELLSHVVRWHEAWRNGVAEPVGPEVPVPRDEAYRVLDELTELLEDNYPFFHPRYAGQMLQPPPDVTVAAYLAAMLINPNAHDVDGGPATVRLEREVVGQLREMVGLPGGGIGHLASGGSTANHEALFVARQVMMERSRPRLGLTFSEQAHYSHARSARVLGLNPLPIRCDSAGRMDITDLKATLRRGDVGIVVVTLGTTGVGAVDPLHEVFEVASEYGAWVHVDAAYGGYFVLLARSGAVASQSLLPDLGPWSVLGRADSVVVDPHKHGLQPYGCGSVLYRDESVLKHLMDYDGPYLNYSSDDFAPSSAALEGSRPGAVAAALWATLRLFPLKPDGAFAAQLGASRRAARSWEDRVAGSSVFRNYQPSDLDIVTYFDARAHRTSQVTASTRRVIQAGMRSPNPVHVAALRVPAQRFAARHPDMEVDTAEVEILRSVLLKAVHETWVEKLVTELEVLASTA
jgi:glutamate/tyrosine decarboxylase-like PLP-dependent enzyme